MGAWTMARVTIEDCIDKIPNRFRLVMLAAQRTRELSSGAVPKVSRDNDKNHVIALREIADESVGAAELENRYLEAVKTLQFGRTSQSTREAELRQAMSTEETTYLNEDLLHLNEDFFKESRGDKVVKGEDLADDSSGDEGI